MFDQNKQILYSRNFYFDSDIFQRLFTRFRFFDFKFHLTLIQSSMILPKTLKVNSNFIMIKMLLWQLMIDRLNFSTGQKALRFTIKTRNFYFWTKISSNTFGPNRKSLSAGNPLQTNLTLGWLSKENWYINIPSIWREIIKC